MTFEEVLGPLVDLMAADSEWRLHTFLVRQLRKVITVAFSTSPPLPPLDCNCCRHPPITSPPPSPPLTPSQVGARMKSKTAADFTPQGSVAERSPVSYTLVRAPPNPPTPSQPDGFCPEYTMKMVSKVQLLEMGSSHEARYREELRLASNLCGRSRFLPLALTTFETPTHLCSILPTRVATSLRDLLESEKRMHFGSISVRYYAASVALVLEHLHAEMPAFGGVVCRDLSPEAFVVDDTGCLQLLDLRCAY